MHERRHKETAELVLEIQALDGQSAPTSEDEQQDRSPRAHRLGNKPSVMKLASPHPAEVGKAGTEMPKTPSKANGKEKREQKQAAKIEKEQKKARQRQGKNGLAKSVSQGLVDEVGCAIHGPNPCYASNSPGELSARLLECVNLHRHLESQLGNQKSPKRRNSAKDEFSGSKLELEFVCDVIDTLGVKIIDDGPKERSELLEKLAEAIYQDIEFFSKESQETLVRFAAYWKLVV